jgi:hypothetical protein
VFHMLCMFGQLSPLLGDLKISLLRPGIACSRRHSFGFFGSLPVFFRSFHADALRSLNELRTPPTLNQGTLALTDRFCRKVDMPGPKPGIVQKEWTLLTDRNRKFAHPRRIVVPWSSTPHPEGIPDCGSFEIHFPDGRPSRYFYSDDIAGRRLRPGS